MLLVLLYKSVDDLNPTIYYTSDEDDAHDVGSGAEYHSYTIVEVAKAETYTNDED